MSAVQKKGGLHIFGITLYAQQLLSLLSVIAVIILVIYMRKVIAPLSKVPEIENAYKENETVTK